MAHWSDQYLDLPYEQADCAELAVLVLQEQFDRTIALPTDRIGGLRGVSHQIADLQADFAEPTQSPVDGDAVLMIGRGRLNHIGIYCLMDGEPWVLHAMRKVGRTRRHRIRTLDRIGLAVEGFYRWK